MKKLLLLLFLIPNLVMGDNNSEKSIGWIYKGEVLHPYCFQKQWVSSDNIQQYYEEFIGKTENYYHSKKFEDFSMIGLPLKKNQNILTFHCYHKSSGHQFGRAFQLT